MNKNCPSKTLTIPDSMVSKSKPAETNDYVEISAANINNLVGEKISVSGTIHTPETTIANLEIYYDPSTDTTHIQNWSKNLAVHMGNNETVRILDSGKIVVNNDLDIHGNIKMENCMLGNLEAGNINLLGDILATNVSATNNIKVAHHLESTTAHIHGDVEIDGDIKTKKVFSSKVKTPLLKALATKTVIVESPDDLHLLAGPNNTVNIPNVRYSVDMSGFPTITPPMVRTNKIFIINKNILLQGDITCDAMEIILYNQSPALVIIRDVSTIIHHLGPNCAVKLVYLALVNRWCKM